MDEPLISGGADGGYGALPASPTYDVGGSGGRDGGDENGANDGSLEGNMGTITKRASLMDRPAFGEKSITKYGSFILILNNAMGPGLVVLPLVVAESGWFVPTVLFVIINIMTAFSCTMLCDAIQRIPGNRNFNRRVEYTDAARHYFSRRWYLVTKALFHLSIQCSNITAMIVGSQVVDTFIIKIFGISDALNYSGQNGEHSGGMHSRKQAELKPGEDPWHGQTNIISLGFLATAAICIPFSFVNLDENMNFQWFSFYALIILTGIFYVVWVQNWHDEVEAYHAGKVHYAGAVSPSNPTGLVKEYTPHAHFWTSMEGQLNVLGSTVFTFAYVISIPSWLNEKKHDVSVNKVLWSQSILGFFMMLAFAILGAMGEVLIAEEGTGPNSHPHVASLQCQHATYSDDSCHIVHGGESVLNLLTFKSNSQFTQIVTYLWNLLTIIPGIPVYSVIIRYNLLQDKSFKVGKFAAFAWAVLLPWGIVMFTYERKVLLSITSWGGILVQGFANFAVPAALYYRAIHVYPYPHERHYGRARLPSARQIEEIRSSSFCGADAEAEVILAALKEATGGDVARGSPARPKQRGRRRGRGPSPVQELDDKARPLSPPSVYLSVPFLYCVFVLSRPVPSRLRPLASAADILPVFPPCRSM